MPICNNCGSSVAAGEALCPNCHAPQSAGPLPQGATQSAGQPPQYGQPNYGPPPYGQYGQNPYPDQSKSHTITLLLCFFLGYLGIHRFYVGKIGTGILMLFTGGVFGIMLIYDFIVLCFGTFRDSNGYPLADQSKTLCMVLFIMFALSIVISIVFIIIAIRALPFV